MKWFNHMVPSWSNKDDSKKFLIAGLGNMGIDYVGTRHNIGFDIVSSLANEKNLVFESKRYADTTTYSFKGRTLILIKPSTYMNLSGKAISYWIQKEKIPVQNMMVITDDLALPFGKIRIRAKGGAGGHNGLNHIIETLGTTEFSRMRFGIGSEFSAGKQADFVLSPWFPEENELLSERIEIAIAAVKCFVSMGVGRAMTQYNM